jgi:hypothetical protein
MNKHVVKHIASLLVHSHLKDYSSGQIIFGLAACRNFYTRDPPASLEKTASLNPQTDFSLEVSDGVIVIVSFLVHMYRYPSNKSGLPVVTVKLRETIRGAYTKSREDSGVRTAVDHRPAQGQGGVFLGLTERVFRDSKTRSSYRYRYFSV